MTVAVRTGLRQGSEEWLDARRSLITSTDLPVLLGISPWACEADLADEKQTGKRREATLRMKVGTALEDLIADEYTAQTGRRVQRIRDLVVHPDLSWAGASPDRRVIGERRAVELKFTGSRTRFADGIPQDVEAQVIWALGVLGWDIADVAVLHGDDVTVYPVPANPALFADLVAVATDFRRRLADGGPFSRDLARIKRDHPADNGAEMLADAELDTAIHALVDVRAARKRLEASEAALETTIKSRMADFAVLRGEGWHATWKRTKDVESTDWKSLADGLLRDLPTDQRAPLIGLHTSVREGFRPFRLVMEKEDPE